MQSTPRNRQHHAGRQNNSARGRRGGRGRGAMHGSRQQGYSNVPTVEQVVAGAFVSIVLKADQANGREVQGTVAELLTRGDHPRGIKVRLQDGRVGRVQRMTIGEEGGLARAGEAIVTRTPSRYTDIRQDEYPPLPQNAGISLADYLPPTSTSSEPSRDTIACPVCGEFEGDATAVAYHVDSHFE